MAAQRAEVAVNTFLMTSRCENIAEATKLFEEALFHLKGSLNWIPHKKPPINLWNTGIERATLENVLSHVGLGPAPDQPLLAIYLADVNRET